MNVQRITLALLLWAAVSRLFAQTFSGINRILSTADGLPSSTITGLVQDRAGFIWMATADGLARYDGSNVATTQHPYTRCRVGTRNRTTQ